MRNLSLLSPFDDDGALRVVVEAPRGSTLKLEYLPEDDVFGVARSLPLGMAYPYDWGFIPGTLAEDGDPVDALAIHPSSSYPGVVPPCRLLGMVELLEKDGKGKPQLNNRIIATPGWHKSLQPIEDARKLPREVREQLQQFFVSATAFTGKTITVTGWADGNKALRFLRSCIQEGGNGGGGKGGA